MATQTTSSTATDETKKRLMLEGAKTEIRRIAHGLLDKKIVSEEQLIAECTDLAHEHYVPVGDVYDAVWQRMVLPDTPAYLMLKERASRPRKRA